MNFKSKSLFDKIFSKVSIIKWLSSILVVICLSGCGDKVSGQEISIPAAMPVTSNEVVTTVPKTFTEVAPPEVIQTLRSGLEIYQPQVSIVSPQPEEVFTDNKVNVKLEVHDLPLFKDSKLQLGPHLHLILDNEPYKAIYDVNDANNPIILSDLTPGTHTLRVFASRPWHESFKNEGAYAQTTFHIFTKTEENNPSAELPLLTYSRPNGTYGAEPIMLDFYLTNAPLQSVAGDNAGDKMSNWRIRCTINDESFILDRWQPIYLKGFKPGKNWVKLEFLDNNGQPVLNAFNSTTRVINYEPNGQDTLSKIVRGEVTADDVRGIIDAAYQVQTPVVPTPVVPTVEETPVPEAKVEKPATPEMKVPKPEIPQVETPQVETLPTPEVKVSEPESPQVETPQVEVVPTEEVKVPEPESPQVETPQVETVPTPEVKVSEIGTSDISSTNAK